MSVFVSVCVILLISVHGYEQDKAYIHFYILSDKLFIYCV